MHAAAPAKLAEIKARDVHPLVWATLAALLVLLWQMATVRANYDGNWSAFFCTGSLQPIPPALKAEATYTFPDSHGYDGQFYHYIAHDPFRRRDLYKYIDEPGLRYRRILVPLMAWAIAGGRDDFIHAGLRAVVLAWILLGTYWLSMCAQSSGRSTAWGLLFMATPAAILMADRMLVDGALAALTAAFLLWSDRDSSWQLWLILALAALTRETGILLAIASCVAALCQRRFRSVLLAASAVIPCAAWYLYVSTHTPAFRYSPSTIPFAAVFHAALHPTAYPARIPFVGVIRIADFAALCGAVLGLSLGWVRSRFWLGSSARTAALLFAALGAFVQADDLWIHLGRVLSPLLVILVWEWLRGGTVLFLAPLLLMLPRVLFQMGNQVVGVVRALGG